jgi:IstB-like ATP binding protein
MLQSVAIIPGTGKTHLAIGLAIRACQAGHRVLFATAAEWVARLADTHHAGRLQAELLRLGRYPLLVIDEVGYIPFEAEAANLFFQLVSARYERASLIVTSNKPFGKAHVFAATCARRRLKRGMFGNVGRTDGRTVGGEGVSAATATAGLPVPSRRAWHGGLRIPVPLLWRYFFCCLGKRWPVPFFLFLEKLWVVRFSLFLRSSIARSARPWVNLTQNGFSAAIARAIMGTSSFRAG